MADRKSSTASRAPAGNGAPNEASVSAFATTTTTQTTPAAANVRSTSPYGTRSRNRGSRVNYAEDKDNDMDYEYTSTPSAASSSSKSGAGVAVEVAVAPTTASSRRASAVGGTGSKDKEGATAMVATVTSTGSKKRKNHHIAPVMPRDLGLSNMLSFENPYMRDGKLIACDGTTLSVNGTSSMFLNLPSFSFRQKVSQTVLLRTPLTLFYRPYLPRLRTSWRALLSRPHHGVSTYK